MSRAAALILAVVATPLSAQGIDVLACTFESECLMGEACAPSGYELTVVDGVPDSSIPDEVRGSVPRPFVALRGVAGDVPAYLMTDSPEGRVWIGADGLDGHMLSVMADGTAIYTAQVPSAELSLTYAGTCEAPS